MQNILPACTRYQRSVYGQRSWCIIDDWSTSHQVRACYGRAGTDGTPSAPFLRLERSQCLLRHATHVGANAPKAKSPVLSAAMAAKLLPHLRFGSSSPFVVLTRRAYRIHTKYCTGGADFAWYKTCRGNSECLVQIWSAAQTAGSILWRGIRPFHNALVQVYRVFVSVLLRSYVVTCLIHDWRDVAFQSQGGTACSQAQGGYGSWY